MSPTPRPGILQIEPYVPGKSSLPGGVKPIKLSSNDGRAGPQPALRIEAFKRARRRHAPFIPIPARRRSRRRSASATASSPSASSAATARTS